MWILYWLYCIMKWRAYKRLLPRKTHSQDLERSRRGVFVILETLLLQLHSWRVLFCLFPVFFSKRGVCRFNSYAICSNYVSTSTVVQYELSLWLQVYLWLEALKKSVTMDTLSANNTVVCYHISRTLIGTGQYMTNVTPLKLSTVNEIFMLLMMWMSGL